jgi:FAD/FMN-containing dehydrogenase
MENLNIKGQLITQNDSGFHEAIMGTLFNKWDSGRRPLMMVSPKNIDDIISTIHYAKSIGKKISICSGGHSWSANHVRNDSILINMKSFNQYEINREAMTAKVGPGVGGSTLLIELFKQDLFFPAGHCKGVCLGGYLLQGGFGWNGRKYGMACENVIGLDIVTANGEYIHANETENADLFWAARGSGGGFFGVVVAFHLRLFKKPAYCGSITHVFDIKHLESVYHWAAEVGPTIPEAVEFQMLMSGSVLKYFGKGIEAVAPIFAETKEEFEASKAFMIDSPIKKKAFFRTPCLPTNMSAMYSAAMTHYPDNHHWGVDNMWTKAPVEQLIPYLKEMSNNLPPAPSHVLWLNWYPPKRKTDMAFSLEDNIYIALYGTWENPADTPKYGTWANDWMQKMNHLSTGIQLADESLHKRTSPFVSENHLQKLDEIRANRDKEELFHAWHSRPVLS